LRRASVEVRGEVHAPRLATEPLSGRSAERLEGSRQTAECPLQVVAGVVRVVENVVDESLDTTEHGVVVVLVHSLNAAPVVNGSIESGAAVKGDSVHDAHVAVGVVGAVVVVEEEVGTHAGGRHGSQTLNETVVCVAKADKSVVPAREAIRKNALNGLCQSSRIVPIGLRLWCKSQTN